MVYNGSWSTYDVQSLTGETIDGVMGFADDGATFLYAFERTGKVFRFNGATWSFLSKYPLIVASEAKGQVFADQCYIFTNMNNVISGKYAPGNGSLIRYDTTEDKWVEVMNLPIEEDPTKALSLNGDKMFAMGVHRIYELDKEKIDGNNTLALSTGINKVEFDGSDWWTI